ncbi:MAG TPA: cyclic nucleotide-binding protein [Cyanobacteria bacterium UBA8553]|nr:cyclic nucleotide-binding protein [Cyanobacteria bacterium UBA8553]
MKHLHQLFYPSTWSFAAKLSAVMLVVVLLPISLIAYYQPICQNSLSVLVIGAIATICALILTQRMTRPIRALTKTAKKLEQDNFSLQALVKVSRSRDDIGHLARIFLHIAEEVKAVREQKRQQQVKDVLLKELSNSDINWLIATGHQVKIAPGTVLIEEGQVVETLYIVLDGTLSVTVSQGKTSEWEIAQLGSGEIVGESLFIGTPAIATTIKALEPSLVLSIPQQQLTAKLQQDIGFASRFTRAIAILLSDRLHSTISQLSNPQLLQDQPLRDMLFVLGELNDSDIDWLIKSGTRQKITANTVLIHEQRSVDALYILLSGTMTVSISENKRNVLVRAFTARENRESLGQEITKLSRGEIMGETPFIDDRLPSATVKALEDSLVLSIHRSRLVAKLQLDVGFASRFYRVIATLHSNKLQEIFRRLGYSQPVDRKNQPLDKAIEYEDELDFSVLDRMALAGTRFDWMLSRLTGV